MINKKLLLCSILLIVGLIFKFNVTKNINEESLKPKGEKKNLLSMNLEQTAGAGDYKTVTQSEWPTDGYKVNSELSRCENGSELSWDDTKKVVVVTGNLSDKCYVYFDIYQPTLAEYIKSQYTGIQGENGIYYHNSSLSNGAGDNSYRYAGANPNNYVCFGSNETTCPEENLYRIIGVFDKSVKLIKYDYATSEMLGTNGLYSEDVEIANFSNYKGSLNNIAMFKTAYDSSLAYNNETMIIKLSNHKGSLAAGDPCDSAIIDNIKFTPLGEINLNTNFVNYLSDSFKTKIKNNSWIINMFINSAYSDTVQNIFLIEHASDGIAYEAKIGLMYASDYGYASNPNLWTMTMDNYTDTNIGLNNWMYMGVKENIITDYQSPCNRIIISSNGSLDFISSSMVTTAIRPAFYLEPSVTYKSGLGTKDSPIILGD